MEPQSLKILGIDPGAKNCGYSFIEFSLDSPKENPKYLTSGVIGLERARDLEESYSDYKVRLIEYGVAAFQDLLDELFPDFVVFEFVPVSNTAAAGQRVLAFVMATCGQVMCNLNGVPWAEMSAVTVKKQLTDSGRATKPQVKKAVHSIFPDLAAQKRMADEIDAIAIPLAWMKRKNTES